MTISQVGLNTADWTASTPATATTRNYPSGTAADDFVLAYVSYFLSGGGTLDADEGLAVLSGSNLNYLSGNYTGVLSHVHAGTEGGTFTVSYGGTAYATLAVSAWRGTVETPSIASSTWADTSSEPRECTAPSVTAEAGDVLIAIFFVSDPITGGSAPAGMTLINTGSSSTMTLRAYKQDISSGGATGAKTLSWTNADRDSRAVSILLREGEGGGSSFNAAWASGSNQVLMG